eukprot:XP_014043261.1 PREDICTED: condensin complex subunit 3-like [Salmo salar]
MARVTPPSRKARVTLPSRMARVTPPSRKARGEGPPLEPNPPPPCNKYFGVCLCVVESVREVVQVRLLPAWLNLLQGDVLELLHKLDVENCSQTALDTLTALFTHTPQDKLLDHCLQLDNRMLVPAGSLSCERVLYWRALCEFIKTKGDEGEEMLEKLLPEAAVFAEYLYG